MDNKLLTFETKCYENDWEFLLQTDYLDQMIARCGNGKLFQTKQLIINNVKDRQTVAWYAEKKVSEGIIDHYYFAEDYAENALHFFNLTKEDFGKGYYYSISELVGLYLSQTKYHLHFSSDALMQKNADESWIRNAIDLMESNSEYMVANATWNSHFKEAKSESILELAHFYVGYGFSDQCYLVKTDLFRSDIYREHHQSSDRYPTYGGELFEKRVDSYMRNHELKRLTSKDASYIHRNFPKSKLMRVIRKMELKRPCSSIIRHIRTK